MNRRLLLACASLALLAVTAGCTGVFGNDEISESRLAGDESPDYDWNTTTDVRLNITGGEYRAVYDFSNRSELRVYEHQSLGEEGPLRIGTVRFRYPNGTVIKLGQERVRTTDSRTVVELPEEDGMLAYTASHRGKSFRKPVHVEGSYEVVLPAGMRVGVPILSQVQPGADGKALRDGRVHLHWASVSSNNLVVRYYLARDLTIFTAVIVGGVLIAIVGLAYYRLQIRKLERRRKEMGLNVDTSDDEFDQGPPPGMG